MPPAYNPVYVRRDSDPYLTPEPSLSLTTSSGPPSPRALFATLTPESTGSGPAAAKSAPPRREIPSFVLAHAPLVHLHPQEPFWPACHGTHLQHFHPSRAGPDGARLDPVLAEPKGAFGLLGHELVNHESVYLQCREDLRRKRDYEWVVSSAGKPDGSGRSTSPATVICVEKAGGVLDAFWFFFYSFNLGPTVAGIRFGNHSADWEHCMIRFQGGAPQAIHLSSHADGFAYTWDCISKAQNDARRPLIYSAIGSHAMYPTPGVHDYSPVKRVGPKDYTSGAGPLWDPRLHFRGFWHEPGGGDAGWTAAAEQDDEFLPCLRFRGRWGDQFSAPATKEPQLGGVSFLDRTRRAALLHHLRWGDGVTGPRDKSLDRPGMNRRNNKIRATVGGA